MDTGINKHFKHLNSASNEPLPFEKEQGITFPIDSCGKIIPDAAKDFAEQNEIPLPLVANTLLAVMNASVHGYANLNIGSRSQPLSQYFCTIAPSGLRKSTVFSAALSGIKEREDKKKRLYKIAQDEYKNKKAWFKKQHDTLMKDALSEQEYLIGKKNLGNEPLPPKDVTMHIKSGTVEGIKRKFKEGSSVLAWHTDEAGSFISGHSMQAENIDAACSFLNDMYSTGSSDKNIGGEQSASFSGRRLSVHVMPQPKLARKLIGNDALDDNGLLARFLIVSCSFGSDSDSEDDDLNVTYKEEDSTFPKTFTRFIDRSFEIVSWELPLDETLPDELKPLSISLDAEAYDLYKKFEKKILRRVKEGGDYSYILGLALKAHDSAARLASQLTIFDNTVNENGALPTELPKVNYAYMQFGINLMEFYLNQAIALAVDVPRSDTENRAAKAYERWKRLISDEPNDTILFMDEFQKKVCKLRSVSEARSISDVLVKRGLVKPLKDTEVKGAKRKEAFEIVQYSA